MKNIIIIIALFLVTLTAKADWVKTGELDSLYLGDAPITFSKYSPDYTKFVTYAAQDSTLRLWDLGTGKVIKERTFDWAYKYDVCEFDFESEYFMFVINDGTTYPNSLVSSSMKNQYLWYINFDSGLFNFEVNNPLNSNGSICRRNSRMIFLLLEESNLNIVTNHFYKICSSGTFDYTKSSSQYYDIKLGMKYIKSIEDNIYQDTKIYNNGLYSLMINSYYGLGSNQYFRNTYSLSLLIKFSFSSLYLKNYYNYSDNYLNPDGYFDLEKQKELEIQANNRKSYPYFLDQKQNPIVPLEVNGEYFAFLDTASNVRIFSAIKNKLLDVNYKSGTLRNFLFINSPVNSVFYSDSNIVTVYNNFKNITEELIYLPEGKLAFDNKTKILYSNRNNLLYIRKIEAAMQSYQDIWVVKQKNIVNEKIQINTIFPDNSSNRMVEVNNVNYSIENPVIQIDKPGIYSAKLKYTVNGQALSFQKDSIVIIKDSLKFTYIVKHDFNNNSKYPFYFEANSNDSLAKFEWVYAYEVANNSTGPNYASPNKSQTFIGSSSTINMNYGGRIYLKCYNEFENKEILIKEAKPKPNLSLIPNSFTGVAPFKFFGSFESTYLTQVYFAVYNPNNPNNSIYVSYYEKALIIDSVPIFTSNNLKDDFVIRYFLKPGIYKIKMSYANDTLTLDSVITVLAPTDIQDFDEKKYIFKQDADGIYCKLEGEGEVSLFDNVGRLVRTYQIENERYIRKEDLERGVYFLSIQTGGNVYHEKVLVE